jgi:hypothetical protein
LKQFKLSFDQFNERIGGPPARSPRGCIANAGLPFHEQILGALGENLLSAADEEEDVGILCRRGVNLVVRKGLSARRGQGRPVALREIRREREVVDS